MNLNEENIRLGLLDKTTESDIKFQKFIRQVLVNTLISLIILSFVLSLFLTFIFVNKLEFKNKDIYSMLYPENLIVYDINEIPFAVGDYKNYNIYLNNGEISQYLKKEIVELEDKSFYRNKGLNFSYIFIDIYNIFKNKAISKETISSKLVKDFKYKTNNVIEKKILELFCSLAVENKFSKDEIISIYLNNLSLKNTGKGLDENAKLYFGKDVLILNKKESKLFSLMLLGKKKIKRFSSNTKIINTSKYSYFIDYSMNEAKIKLKTIDIKGLKIYTSLDRTLQRASEAVMKSNLAKLSMLNKKTEGAFLLIDSKSGAIIAMVGGNEFIKGDFNRAYQSKRAVGSTFKPIIYLMALEKGLISPNSILKDEPVSYNGKNEKWTPKNWDGEYLGNLDVKKSLELSRNTIAIKLASKIGVEQIIQRSKTFGITGNLPRDLSISIGSAGMTLKELGGVYLMFSREGKYIAPYAVTKILAQNGEEIYKTKVVFNRVASQKSTKQLNNLLEQRKDSQIFQKLKKQNVPIYGKTGTSDKFRDLWFSGYNKDITGIIWIGNDKNQPMTKVYSTHCSEIWLELANYYYDFKN